MLGASAGSRDFDQLFDSVRAIRDSEEFNDFLAALRSHASHTLRELADMLERVGPESLDEQRSRRAREANRRTRLISRSGLLTAWSVMS